MQGDFDLVGIPGNRLVDTVIDDFLDQVIRAGGIGLHSRPFTHGVQAGQDFNIRCIVFIV